MGAQIPAASKSTCQFQKQDGELCRRTVHPGERTCWQHARGVSHKWNSLTKNQSLIFIGTIFGIIIGPITLYLALLDSRPPGYMQLDKIYIQNQQLVAGDRLKINVWIKNEGARPVNNVYWYIRMDLVAIRSDENEVDRQKRAEFTRDAMIRHEKLMDGGNKGFTAGRGDSLWDTLTLPPENLPPLTQVQVDEILRGSFRLYLYVWTRWKDAPQDYEQCLTLQPPIKNDLATEDVVWHSCAN